MPDLSQITHFADTVALPLIGVWSLVALKLSVGDAEQRAQRRFFLTLIVMTIVTLRTVIACDHSWLIHTTMTGSMIVASLVLPSRSDDVTWNSETTSLTEAPYGQVT
ncbi:hypothetical protein [Stieleria varia]|uniref:Uncharacterized protein n=1 Tax=Stieleria varia TaxID=2528005 RepID=A0A5C6A1K6_9BACT|nr:hypothetical protein [Stieleria varia]TWT93200.1 hypothetical protein Pla52n_58570 [Stieleria varia]